jgi:hypothetical protein
MAAVRVDAEPVFIEMRISTIGAPDVTHIESEYAADHVVHGIDFRNQQAFRRKLVANQPDCPIGGVYVFVPVGILPCVNMDSKIQRKAGRIIDGWNRTPQAHSTGIFVEIKIENLMRQNRWKVGGSARHRRSTVLGGGIGFMYKAPVSRATIAPFSDGRDIAITHLL